MNERSDHVKSSPSVPNSPADPRHPKSAATRGLAGDFVRLVEPASEADPWALLVSFLVTAGNVIGDGPHFIAEADKHPVRLFAALVGATAKARKGSSWGHVRRLFRTVAPDWAESSILSGLSTGEGLIHQLRDAPASGVSSTSHHVDHLDRGVPDKRLLVVASEMGRLFRVMQRRDNTLADILREAWDTGDLHVLTRSDPLRATGAHISIVAHITREELRETAKTDWIYNGLLNRFLWIHTERSKVLPESVQIDGARLHAFTQELQRSIEFARTVGTLIRDQEATELWRRVYPRLTDCPPGVLGAVTSRADPQVMRLACLYALLDHSTKVRKCHLEAALALWQHSLESAGMIFGSNTGDRDGDRLLTAISRSLNGLTRTEISDFFHRNKSKAELDDLLELLQRQSRICRKPEAGPDDRLIERWVKVQS